MARKEDQGVIHCCHNLSGLALETLSGFGASEDLNVLVSGDGEMKNKKKVDKRAIWQMGELFCCCC